MHPVDVVKTRLQFQGEQGNAVGAKQYRGVFSSLRMIARHEGFAGLYRGIVPAYGLQFAVTATRFGVYGLAKDFLAEYDKAQGNEGADSFGRNFLLAAVSGACGAVFGNPFFALKTRAQAYSSSKDLGTGARSKPPASLFRSMIDIYQMEGLKGYFRGFDAFVPRVVAYGAVQLGVYDFAKETLRRTFHLNDGFPLQAGTAFIAAISAVVAIQPFDFLAARLMNQPVDPVTKKGTLYNGFLDCAYKSVKAEGVMCFSKGGWANMCRMGPYTVLVLVFFEQSKKIVNSVKRSEVIKS
eukprot:CAMPEP_0203749512 /NCGR_PEP_ID=MMETSP0098-20131031/4053_1 /ASSEMBLY_ACC=CAM_ASM_000208 /TAXON_ID=96639 /ORGANISM=" , Strain NY0313808BC1" /LENGTH=295 /DNA_ID=CAMNT_0050638585 /DNA_START=240 /DNA_END=1127 /DNA_ORIENTATION=-